MRTYIFYYKTDCSIRNEPVLVEAPRLDSALDTFLSLISSRTDFYRLFVFNYRVTSNGKSQNRHLKCPHYYVLIESKCVRYFPNEVSFKSLLTN